MRNTTPPNHHHEKDEEPDITTYEKCTKYSHTLHEFGACQISIRQV